MYDDQLIFKSPPFFRQSFPAREFYPFRLRGGPPLLKETFLEEAPVPVFFGDSPPSTFFLLPDGNSHHSIIRYAAEFSAHPRSAEGSLSPLFPSFSSLFPLFPSKRDTSDQRARPSARKPHLLLFSFFREGEFFFQSSASALSRNDDPFSPSRPRRFCSRRARNQIAPYFFLSSPSLRTFILLQAVGSWRAAPIFSFFRLSSPTWTFPAWFLCFF